jgi:twitching motility protein PilT
MAQIDKFIEALHARGGQSLIIEADEEPVILRAGQRLPLSSRKPTAEQVRRLVAEVVTTDARTKLASAGGAGFELSVGALPRMYVLVSEWRGATSVTVRPAVAGAALEPPKPLPKPAGTPPGPPPRPAETLRHAEPQFADGAIDLGDDRISGEALDLGHTIESMDAPRDKHAIDVLFRMLVNTGSSDLHMSSDEIPMIRKDGEMRRLDYPRQNSASLLELLMPIIPEINRNEFETDGDTDFAYEIKGLARFRANLFRDRKGVGAVFRTIPATILTVEQLGLSKAICDLCRLKKGLVLVTGPTGSGKSTTLCSLIDLINRTRSDHIITIEDPIEFVHENKKCLVNQREVRIHTQSFKRALRAALREDPDIVLVGEMRDLETIAIAIETAETGHLVFGTLHTSTAYSTIDRIIDQFPPDQQEQIRVMLSESLKGVISQTLCKKIGGGRVAALEVLLTNPAIANLIREGKTFQIPSIMQTNRGAGMVLLNEALLDLVQKDKITTEEALLKAIDKPGMRAMLKNANIPFEA